MKSKYYLGVDPGSSGGVGLIPVNPDDDPICYPLPETEHDTAELLRELAPSVRIACIENVHAMPKQGVSSTFKFGRNVGLLRGILAALQIPFREVSPAVWQRALSCLSSGNKNITKSRAQQLFPKLKITHKVADGLLIGYWLKQQEGKNESF